MSYQVPQNINKNKIFVLNKSEIGNRLDAHYNKPAYIELWQTLSTNSYSLSNLKNNSICIFSGITPKSGGDAYVLNDGIPFLRSGDFSETNEINFSNLLQLRKDIHNTTMRGSQLKKGDLLIAIVGATIGKIGVYVYDIEANINQAICAVRLKPELNPYYVQAFFQTGIGQTIIDRVKRPVARANINLEEVGSLPIPMLDKQQQAKIVKVMNEGFNSLKEKKKEAQKLLESIDNYFLGTLGIQLPERKSQTLQDRMFIVNNSVLEGRLDPYYSQEYFRNAFEVLGACKYSVVNLKEISMLITSGITPKSGGDAYTEDKSIGIPFVRSGNISIDGELNYDDLLYLKPEIHENVMSSSKLKKDDILIAIVGATIGQVGIYLSEGEANINQAIALVRLKEGYNAQFVKELIKSSIGQLSLNRLKRPVARANINLEEISRIKVVLPPEEKQEEIVEHITAIRQQAKVLQEEGKAILEQAKRKVEGMILYG